jgi:hypothetical protein
LGCPFGCREAHRKQRSTERSVTYYATAEGKVKKKMQNGRRARGEVRADANPPVLEATEFPAVEATEFPAVEATEFPAVMVGYVAMVASLIEGRLVSEEEIVRMLVRAMRQHSMARRRRMDYVVAQLNERGP